MFSLIISIIAIALVAALALASIYYGGSAFQEGSTDAEASTVVNQGQQIQAAVTMADVDEKWTSTSVHTDLVDNDFLKEVPALRGKSWTIAAGAEVAKLELFDTDYALTDVCAVIEEKFDGDNTVDATEPASGSHQAFGCYGAAGAEVAYYKL